MAYHEYLDYMWKEETESLKWFSGVIFIAGFAYYIISYNPYLAAAIIYPVAWITVVIMNGLGLLPTGEALYLEEINYSDPSNVYVPIPPVSINIILACTAIQAIIIFAAVILSTSTGMKLRLKVTGVIIGVIYPLNIIRNIATIWLVGTGTTSFYIAHEVLGKTFSLVILMILAYWTFTKIPEILDNIFGLLDLRFRNKKGMIKDGFIVIPQKNHNINQVSKSTNLPGKKVKSENRKNEDNQSKNND